MSVKNHENDLAKTAFLLGLKVHKSLGPGLLESVYEECLFYELLNAGLFVERQKPIPVLYEGNKLDSGFRADLVIEKKLIIELKSVEALADIHTAVMLTYLKFSGCKLGLLMNFNTVYFKNGVKRIIAGKLDENYNEKN